MSGNAKLCERCGRKPAKRFEFRAHRGFLVARRVIDVAGVFCRDCAIEAYCYAKGVTLKGMWFSPGSLVLGTLSSIWDSVKLLDLPDKVKDSPWTWHNVACPHCRMKTKDFAGATVCEQCQQRLAILSCARCKCVNVRSLGNSLPDAMWFRCRSCSHVTEAATAARNAPHLLFARMLAEIAGQIKWASDSETWAWDPVDPDHWIAAFVEEHEIHDNTIPWLQDQFARRFDDHRTPVIYATLRAGLASHVAVTFSLAAMVSTPSHRRRLHSFAVRLGLASPSSVAPTESEDFQKACSCLGVSPTASRAEVDRAYRRAASRVHPDRTINQEADDRAKSLELMKQINAAFELVCEWFDQRGDSTSASPAPWRDEDAIAEIRRRSEVAKAARAQAQASRAASSGQSQREQSQPTAKPTTESDVHRCGPDATEKAGNMGACTAEPVAEIQDTNIDPATSTGDATSGPTERGQRPPAAPTSQKLVRLVSAIVWVSTAFALLVILAIGQIINRSFEARRDHDSGGAATTELSPLVPRVKDHLQTLPFDLGSLTRDPYEEVNRKLLVTRFHQAEPGMVVRLMEYAEVVRANGNGVEVVINGRRCQWLLHSDQAKAIEDRHLVLGRERILFEGLFVLGEVFTERDELGEVGLVVPIMSLQELMSPGEVRHAMSLAVGRRESGALRRRFADNSGKYSVDGYAIAINDGHLRLLRHEERSMVTVPLSRLSAADRSWVAERRSTIEQMGQHARRYLRGEREP